MDDNSYTSQFSDLVTVLKLSNQNMGLFIQQFQTRLAAQSATNATLGISNAGSSSTQVYIGNGLLTSVSVIAASSGSSITGTAYDSNTQVGLGSSCAIGIIPSSGMMTYNWPFTKGLVVTSASSNQTIAVSYVTFPTVARSS